MYERLAVCMWASVSMRRAALCAASVSSWGGTVWKARELHVLFMLFMQLARSTLVDP